ncbi:rod-binding protein [Pseudodesulfovibrio piezophilus]|uniref:Muramidase, Rod binding protein n=1 Tax=Pseudodesulfovibrio piezophilus (strain DSM 21447 / JCM 15486 / C1TLV30) TaxID=1322246 RepID=M1WUY4_PSEP2|nr:rod-binding protein [Pseudodesulfovibrio piezophilus]CCH47993.1 muramidase, Rod binding protein [Pseudodesulfovibrio piezophilus C1TLV30]
MMSAGVDTQLASKQLESRDLIRFKQEMDGLKGRMKGTTNDTEAQLKKACQDFEAVFISKLWKGMKSTVPKEGYLHSKQEEQYMSMFDRDFAEKMAKSGGIGLADMIYDQLSQKLVKTSRDVLPGTVEIKPLAQQPIPLNTASSALSMPETAGKTLEDWGGNAVGGALSLNGGDVLEDPSEEIATISSQPMSDVEVKARLDELTRRLETERIKTGLLGTNPGTVGKSYEALEGGEVGRKIAKIG